MHIISDALNKRNFKLNTLEGAMDCLEVWLHEKKDRLAHSKQVYFNIEILLSKNESLSSLPEQVKEKLRISTLLHDIGYADGINISKFHHVDGYFYLKENGWNESICKCVLFHTHAKELAMMQNRTDILSFYDVELTKEELFITELITLADVHAFPNGEFCLIEQRIENIGERYGFNSTPYEHSKIVEKEMKKLLTIYSF